MYASIIYIYKIRNPALNRIVAACKTTVQIYPLSVRHCPLKVYALQVATRLPKVMHRSVIRDEKRFYLGWADEVQHASLAD